jgi:hypothetical protein
MKTRYLGLMIFAVSSLLLSFTGESWSDPNDYGMMPGGVAAAPRTQSQVKQITGPIWILVPSTPSALTSISVTPPGKGYIILTATGSFNFTHTTGTQGYFCLDLNETEDSVAGCAPMVGSDSGIRSSVPAGFPSTGTDDFGLPFSIVKVYGVNDKSVRTFHLNGYAEHFDQATLFHPSLTALFVPAALP